MVGSINKVIVVGNLGRDPEVRTSQDGTKIVTLSLATSESWKDRATGERKEKTEWHRAVIFNQHFAEVAEKFLKKGSTVGIEGVLQTRQYMRKVDVDIQVGKKTEKRTVEVPSYSTEIVIGKFKGELTLLDKAPGNGRQDNSGWEPRADMDDEIPF